MMNRFIYIVLNIFGYFCHVYGQTLPSIYIERINTAINEKTLDKVEQYIDSIETQYPKESSINIAYLNVKCRYLNRKGESDIALALALRMKALLNPNSPNYLDNKILAYTRINDAYYFTHQNEKCHAVLDSLFIWNSQKTYQDPVVLGTYKTQRGILYEEAGKTRKAIEQYIQAEKFVKKTKDLESYQNLYNNIGNAYAKIKEEDKAIEYIQKSKEYIAKNDSIGLFSYYNNLLGTYIICKNKRKARIYKDSLSRFLVTDYFRHNRLFYNAQIEYYNLMNELDSVKFFIELYQNYFKNYYAKKFNKELDELKLSFQREQALIIEKENIENAKQRSNINTNYAILTSIIFFLSIITLYTFFNIKRRQRNIEYSNLESQLLQNQLNPHFIFNTLANIKGLINQGKNAISSKYLNNFSNLLMGLLIDNTKKNIPLKKELAVIESYLELQAIRFKDKFEYKIHCFIDNTEDYLIPPMLIQPCIENSFKHAFVNKNSLWKIDIFFNKEGNIIVCTVKDNGIGLPKKPLEEKQSLSLRINQKRLKILEQDYATQGDLVLSNRVDGIKGVQVIIKIPFKKL